MGVDVQSCTIPLPQKHSCLFFYIFFTTKCNFSVLRSLCMLFPHNFSTIVCFISQHVPVSGEHRAFPPFLLSPPPHQLLSALSLLYLHHLLLPDSLKRVHPLCGRQAQPSPDQPVCHLPQRQVQGKQCSVAQARPHFEFHQPVAMSLHVPLSCHVFPFPSLFQLPGRVNGDLLYLRPL